MRSYAEINSIVGFGCDVFAGLFFASLWKEVKHIFAFLMAMIKLFCFKYIQTYYVVFIF